MAWCTRSSTITEEYGITSILKQEEFPIPRGITSEDINPNLELVDQKATELLFAKGLYLHPPFIPVPEQVDFVKKQSFLTGFFGNKRPLSAIEIRQLFNTAVQNMLGKAMLIGFSQIAQSKEIRNYFERGKEISNKFYKEVTDILIDEDISIPSTLDGEVSDTTEPPFSDRFMLFHVLILSSYGIGNYGMGVGTSQRRDLAALFARMMAESGLYAEDGANLMIENGWLEQPPLAPNRKTLTNG